MFAELSNRQLPDNVYINPEIIEKARYTGTLVQGIVSNISFSLSEFVFKYFMVLSGRTIFYSDMSVDDLERLQPRWANLDEMKTGVPRIASAWLRPVFARTKLGVHYLRAHCPLTTSAHEGLCFSYNVSARIIKFINNNLDIAEDIYATKTVVEEFSLQTIAIHERDETNLDYGFIYIGHGTTEVCDYKIKDRYVRKIAWE